MTDQELKDLVASLAIAHKETEKMFQETDKKFHEVEKQIARTDKKLKSIGIQLGNIGNNQGNIAEEFFYRSFVKNRVLGDIQFNEVSRNMNNVVDVVDADNTIKQLQDEYDIVLINGDCIAIIEVKAKAHSNDLEKFVHKKLVNFPILFNKYKDYKLYAGIATLVTNHELIEKAQELGLFLITQQGKHTEIINNGIILH